jgi:CIC family chloride channel protein
LPGRRSLGLRVWPAEAHRSGAAIVFRGVDRPRARDIVGVITKRAIADTVIDNYED